MDFLSASHHTRKFMGPALIVFTVMIAGQPAWACSETAALIPWSTSSSTAGFAPYTVTNTVTGPASTAFSWNPLSATTNAAGTVTATFTTHQAIVESAGTLTSGATSFAAGFCMPVRSAILYYGGELISILFKSPEDIYFESLLTQVGPNLYEVVDTVQNLQSLSVTFDWKAAGFSGTVGPDASVTKMVFGDAGAFENVGFTSFYLGSPSDSVNMYADAFVPVPEPSTYVELGLGTLCIFYLTLGRLRPPAFRRLRPGSS
jgi:hypothetical protein